VIRVGFVFLFDEGWLGGINYFRNLLAALYALPVRKIEAVIFTGLRSPSKHFDAFPAIKIVRSRIFDSGSLPWLIRKFWVRGFSHDLLLVRLLKKHDIAVLSHSGWIGADAAIPAIGWIPDFQHLHLPEFFDEKEISLRDQAFKDLCRYCNKIVVSSMDAQSDLARFLPECRNKSEILQFVVSPTGDGSSLLSHNELAERYGFSGDYFLLPNQFWMHKNHRVVINALGLLRRDGKKVLVLSTGSTDDYRNRNFFDALLADAKKLGVLDSFRPLGVVPLHDLSSLMYHATAIINPSYFEGWSTTVEEAKALGKRIILSDISVHREQNPHHAIYFSPDDAESLAASLWNIWNEPNKNEFQEMESACIATNERRLQFAKKYQQIVLNVLASDKQ
jgi:glycosyltransferase involved in cell wall biosynthesis